MAGQGFGITGQVDGLAGVVATLAGLPGKLQRKVMRKALSKATKPTLMAAKRNCPKDSGTLQKSIGRKVVTYVDSGTLLVVIGPRRGYAAMVVRRGRSKPEKEDPVNIAHLVEFGTRAHSVRKGDKLARTSAMARAADFRHAANVVRWNAAIANAKSDEQRKELQNRIIRSTRYATSRREHKQTAGKMHPGAKAQPFLRPAYDQTKAQVQETFAAEVAAGLAKETAKG